jgi:hypothetical protein
MSKKKGGLAPGHKLYLVERTTWHVEGDRFRPDEEEGGLPVRALLTKAEAEACRDALERQAKLELSPFLFAMGEAEATKGGRKAFDRQLKALGISAPAPKDGDFFENDEWQAWWDGIADGLSEEQRLGAWALVCPDKLYQIVETELESPE